MYCKKYSHKCEGKKRADREGGGTRLGVGLASEGTKQERCRRECQAKFDVRMYENVRDISMRGGPQSVQRTSVKGDVRDRGKEKRKKES